MTGDKPTTPTRNIDYLFCFIYYYLCIIFFLSNCSPSGLACSHDNRMDIFIEFFTWYVSSIHWRLHKRWRFLIFAYLSDRSYSITAVLNFKFETVKVHITHPRWCLWRTLISKQAYISKGNLHFLEDFVEEMPWIKFALHETFFHLVCNWVEEIWKFCSHGFAENLCHRKVGPFDLRGENKPPKRVYHEPSLTAIGVKISSLESVWNPI